jgi:phage-related protein
MCYHRLSCLIIAGQMFLLHGFIKKTPQTPKRDLDLARVRKAEVEQSGEETQP